MSDTATAAAETLVAPVTDNSSPPQPAPQETPANAETPGTAESNAQSGSGAGEPAAAKPDGEQGDESKEKPKKRFQERIDELVADKRSALRDVASLRAEIAELKRMPPPPSNPSLEQETAYEVKKAVREERVEQLERQAKNAEQHAAQRTFDTFAAKAEAVADRMPGLVDKFVTLPEVSQEMASFVAESDKGAEVAFALASNPQEASRIARLSPLHQGIELARLEGRLSKAPEVRKLSTAPAPAPTVTGNPSPAAKSPEEMSQAEYNAWYRKRNKRG